MVGVAATMEAAGTIEAEQDLKKFNLWFPQINAVLL